MTSSEMIKFMTKAEEFLSLHVPLNNDPNIFIAGGFFFRLYHDLPIRDIDVFINEDNSFYRIIKEYEDAGYVTEHVKNTEFMRFKDPVSGINIELIGFHHPKSGHWIDTFDITLCQVEMTGKGDYRIVDIDAFENKIIKYNHKMNFSKPAVNYFINNNVLTRTMKYIKLGCTVSDEELSKLYTIFSRTKPEQYCSIVGNKKDLDKAYEKDVPF